MEGDPFGETILRFGDPLLGSVGDIHGVFVAGAEDVDQDGGIAIEGEGDVGIFEAIVYIGDFAEGDACAVISREDDDIAEFGGGVFSSRGANENFTGVGAEGASG